jgi:hypothetical protein
MRASKWWAGALAVLLLSSTLTGCTMLRTPYELEKMKQASGGKKPTAGGGEEKKGGGGDQKSGEGPASIAAKPEEDKGKKKKAGEGEKKGGGIVYTIPRHMEEKSPRLLYNQSLSTDVSMVQGVGNATVLLDDDHNAYVAIAAPDAKSDEVKKNEDKKMHVKTEGDISEKVQAEIAKTLRKSDPLVSNVYLTNDPEHVRNFDRYATRSLKGNVDDMQSKALAEHIQDIWK